jgi:hypothetical protein
MIHARKTLFYTLAQTCTAQNAESTVLLILDLYTRIETDDTARSQRPQTEDQMIQVYDSITRMSLQLPQ